MGDREVRKINLHGMLLQAGFWFGFCTYVAFMVATLTDHGWSASAAAGAVTTTSVFMLFVKPVYGVLCDRYFSEKKLVVILLLIAVVFLSVLPFSLRTGNNLLVLFNIIMITITGMPVNGLMDAWLVGLKQEMPSVNYGLIRGTGSFFFALSAQVAGAVTIAFSHDARLWLGSAVLLTTVMVALTFRPARRMRDIGRDTAPIDRLSGKEAFRLIFSSKQYCLLLGVSFFMLLSNASMITLIQLLIPEFGGSAAQIGTATAVMAGSEVPFMFLMAFLIKKAGYKKLLVLCSVMYVIRLALTAYVSTVEGLIYVQVLQGLTFAVILPLSMSYLSQILDERVRATAITTFAAVTASLTGILGNLTTTTLLAAGFTTQSALVVFTVSATFGLILTLYGVVRRIWDVKTVTP